ncbi:MAG: hypothetical protein EHM41_15250 [Chloroflexi bacterium]|nr:MAG: hypothetical protein EHM41_15250 [Chloroflexota bacterium]
MITKQKTTVKQTAEIILAILFILSIIITVQVAVDPTVQSMAVDSGLFAYCGQRIVSGELLYRDCWDNKPPGVYYLNAFAILLGGSSHWSIWVFQTLWVAITAFVFFLVIRKIWGSPIAFFTTGIFLLTLLSPGIYQSGNLSESYTLVFIILIFAALYSFLLHQNRFSLVGIGFFTACAFLLKPTYMMAGIAAILTVFITTVQKRNFRWSIFNILVILLSVFIPPLLVASYWISQDAFKELWFAVFTNNRLYIQQSFSMQSMIGTARKLLIEQPLASLTAFTLAGLIAFYSQNWRKLGSILLARINSRQAGTEGSLQDDARHWLMVMVSITVGLDVLMTAISGKNFGHYFQVPLVSMTIGCAYLFSTIIQSVRKSSLHNSHHLAVLSFILVLLVPWSVEVIENQVPGRAKISAFFNQGDIRSYQMSPIEEYIFQNSNPNESVLIWGYDPTIYFVTGMRSPTRFIFLDHLFTPIPKKINGFGVFEAELEADPPGMIAVERDAYLGLLLFAENKMDICPSCSPDSLQGIEQFQEYVDHNYCKVTEISDWAIYKRMMDAP